MPQHRLAVAVGLAAALALAVPSRADDAEFAREFRSAELRETAFGELEEAAGLFRVAAGKATDAAGRARAELRAGSCLRRLGQADEARALLAPLVSGEGVPDDVRRAARAELDAASIAAPPSPAPPPGPAPDQRRLAETERELEEMRAQFDALLQREQALTKQTEDLAQKLLETDKKNRAMQAQIAPASAEEALRVRIEEQERRRRTDHELSRNYASFARRLHREGRFTDARDFVFVALEKDPENAEAKALLTLVSAPLGVRERLHESIRGVLALADEVRGARTAAEIDTLVAEAKRRQERQEFALSVAPLERALALTDADGPYLHDAAAARASVLAMLRDAQVHGAQRSPAPPAPPRDEADARGLAAVRELLSSAGGEVVRGLDLRFHDAGPVLAAAAAGLAPSPLAAYPEGWTISADGAAAGPLLALYLRAAGAADFAVPGASIEAAGSTIVALCDAAAQSRLTGRMSGLADVAAPAAELRVAAYRLAPGSLAALLERRGIRLHAAGGGARFATVPAEDVDATLPDLAKRAEVWPSVAALRATTLRPFRLAAGAAASSLAIDLLPVTRPRAGIALRLASEWTPAGRGDGARMRQEAAAGGMLDPGAALVVLGLADPADPSRELAVIVRQGVAPAAPLPQPAALGLSSSEMLLPPSLRGLTEIGPVPIVVPGHPVESRERALAARFRAAAKSAQSVEVRDDRVRVVGPDEARAAARRFIDQIDVVRGVQAFDVAFYAVSQSVEDHLLADLPRIERRPGDSFARAIVRDDERRNVDRALAGTRGRVPLLDSRIAAPPTGRADAAYVVRSAYRRDLEIAPGPGAAWGRSETALADEGVLVAIRPYGRRETGKVDLDVALRAAWIADRGERRRDTPLGPVTSLEPSLATWSDDLSTTLADDELLVLAGLPNPLGARGERTRFVVTIANAPSR